MNKYAVLTSTALVATLAAVPALAALTSPPNDLPVYPGAKKLSAQMRAPMKSRGREMIAAVYSVKAPPSVERWFGGRRRRRYFAMALRRGEERRNDDRARQVRSSVQRSRRCADGCRNEGRLRRARHARTPLLRQRRIKGSLHAAFAFVVARARARRHSGRSPDGCDRRLPRAKPIQRHGNAVDDLDDLRSALHVKKLDLYGSSDGTFFSFVFTRRHPTSVESAVMSDVAPPGFQPLPGSPDGAQRALNDLIADCNKNRVCHSHFPNFADQFKVVLQRFDDGPRPCAVKAIK